MLLSFVKERTSLPYLSLHEIDQTYIIPGLLSRWHSGKESTCQTGDMGSIPEASLEEGMATHSSVLAWRIPWTEEPGGLQSVGLQSRTRLSD